MNVYLMPLLIWNGFVNICTLASFIFMVCIVLQADENLRMIKASLPEAIEACVDAAGYEFDISRQRTLLRAASYGQAFCRSVWWNFWKFMTLFNLLMQQLDTRYCCICCNSCLSEIPCFGFIYSDNHREFGLAGNITFWNTLWKVIYLFRDFALFVEKKNIRIHKIPPTECSFILGIEMSLAMIFVISHQLFLSLTTIIVPYRVHLIHKSINVFHVLFSIDKLLQYCSRRIFYLVLITWKFYWSFNLQGPSLNYIEETIFNPKWREEWNE